MIERSTYPIDRKPSCGSIFWERFFRYSHSQIASLMFMICIARDQAVTPYLYGSLLE